jgi:hypothetical protein
VKVRHSRYVEGGILPNFSPDLVGADASLVAAATTGKSVAAAAVLEAKSSSTSRAPATDSSTVAASAAATDTREDRMLTLGFLADESKAGDNAGATGASEDDGVATASDSRGAGVDAASSLSSESTIRLRFCDCVFAIEVVAFDVIEERPLSSLSAAISTTFGVSCRAGDATSNCFVALTVAAAGAASTCAC